MTHNHGRKSITMKKVLAAVSLSMVTLLVLPSIIMAEYVDGPNLYAYVNNNPLNTTDPTGLSPGITGSCNISIFAGHAGEVANNFVKSHDVPNSSIVTKCGNYVGAVTCWSNDLLGNIDENRKIPGFPGTDDPLNEKDALDTLKAANKSAEDLANTLCANRKKFCDNGNPDGYKCGANNQRCDSVTITITCDK